MLMREGLVKKIIFVYMQEVKQKYYMYRQLAHWPSLQANGASLSPTLHGFKHTLVCSGQPIGDSSLL